MVMTRSVDGRRGRDRRLLLSLSVFGLVAAVIGAASTFSAFTGTSADAGNTFAAGTVAIGDNDSGSASISMSSARPGDTDTTCIAVTSTGTLPSLVKLYGTTTGTGLDAYLNLVVTRGTGAAGFDDCTGFTADATDWNGLGAGVVYSGTLTAFPDSYAAGVQDPRSSVPEAWTTGESHTYRFALTVADDNNAQGRNFTQTFTWEARNTTLYSQVVLSDRPAAYWKLDEAAGTSAADSAGSSTGTYVNGPSLNQATPVKDAGTAVDFDGTNDFMTAADSVALSPTAAMSIEAWVRPDAFGALRTIVQKTNSYWLRIDNSGAITAFIYDGASYEPRVTGTTLVAGTTYHVVATFSGTSLKVYVDGALRGTTARTTAIPDNASGVNVGVGGSYFDGTIDEVAIYGYELTGQQVTEHYNAGRR
jgi:hypothetical protein